MKRLFGAVAINLLLACASAFAQTDAGTTAKPTLVPTPATQSPEAAIIKAEAEKSSRAFVSGDFSAVLDSTFPRVVEMGGGKAKMLASINAEMKETGELGLKILSHTVGEPEPSVRAATLLLAVVPTTLKMESADSFITQRSFWLAVSTNDGKSWTFIDGSYLNGETLKLILPEAVDKIKLPAGVQPVFERKPAN